MDLQILYLRISYINLETLSGMKLKYTYFMGKQEKQRVKVSLQWYIKVKTEL